MATAFIIIKYRSKSFLEKWLRNLSQKICTLEIDKLAGVSYAHVYNACRITYLNNKKNQNYHPKDSWLSGTTKRENSWVTQVRWVICYNLNSNLSNQVSIQGCLVWFSLFSLLVWLDLTLYLVQKSWICVKWNDFSSSVIFLYVSNVVEVPRHMGNITEKKLGAHYKCKMVVVCRPAFTKIYGFMAIYYKVILVKDMGLLLQAKGLIWWWW